MNLAVDIGNTSVKYGKFSDANLIENGHVDELTDLIYKIENSLDCRVLISSVSGMPDLKGLENSFKSVEALTKDTSLPFRLSYDTPDTLGADRLAAVAGAKSLNPSGTSLVIDLGTCITYDILEDGEIFQGGIISPGKDIRYKSMNLFTYGLPDLSTQEMPTQMQIPAKSTNGSMHAGVIFGILNEIEGFIETYKRKYPDLTTFMCGGYTEFFERNSKHGIFVDSNLVLKGINHILSFNWEDNG